MDTSDLGYTELDFRAALKFAENDPNGPGERTKRVFTHLAKSGQFTNWDLVCFSAEYLASQVGVLPWLETPVKWLIRLVYIAHYIRFEMHSWLDSTVISVAEASKETGSDGASTTGP